MCSKTKRPNTVINKRITMSSLVMMMSKEGGSNSNAMPEKESQSHRLFWTEFKENHKKKSMKCIKGNCSKEGKMKCCSHLLMITRHTQFSAKWEERKMLSSPFSKRQSITKRPKIKSSKLKLLLPWLWRKNILEKSLSRLKIRKLSNKDSKGSLMSTLRRSTNCNMKTTPISLLLDKHNRPNSSKILTLESKRESTKMT